MMDNICWSLLNRVNSDTRTPMLGCMTELSTVHFDCLYRGITAVSSRESKLLAGNCIIAQVGAPPGKERKREFVDNPNGLFSAQAAPKPQRPCT
ncbi:unnamed protein product [Ilex paraguariensis]|uniref:Uncharacterized protein n=1 Tax=Ilex paraguariensis TaxID=185542 RepID=A0ABC8S8E6_9AQUA